MSKKEKIPYEDKATITRSKEVQPIILLSSQISRSAGKLNKFFSDNFDKREFINSRNIIEVLYFLELCRSKQFENLGWFTQQDIVEIYKERLNRDQNFRKKFIKNFNAAEYVRLILDEVLRVKSTDNSLALREITFDEELNYKVNDLTAFFRTIWDDNKKTAKYKLNKNLMDFLFTTYEGIADKENGMDLSKLKEKFQLDHAKPENIFNLIERLIRTFQQASEELKNATIDRKQQSTIETIDSYNKILLKWNSDLQEIQTTADTNVKKLNDHLTKIQGITHESDSTFEEWEKCLVEEQYLQKLIAEQLHQVTADLTNFSKNRKLEISITFTERKLDDLLTINNLDDLNKNGKIFLSLFTREEEPKDLSLFQLFNGLVTKDRNISEEQDTIEFLDEEKEKRIEAEEKEKKIILQGNIEKFLKSLMKKLPNNRAIDLSTLLEDNDFKKDLESNLSNSLNILQILSSQPQIEVIPIKAIYQNQIGYNLKTVSFTLSNLHIKQLMIMANSNPNIILKNNRQKHSISDLTFFKKEGNKK